MTHGRGRVGAGGRIYCVIHGITSVKRITETVPIHTMFSLYFLNQEQKLNSTTIPAKTHQKRKQGMVKGRKGRGCMKSRISVAVKKAPKMRLYVVLGPLEIGGIQRHRASGYFNQSK